MNNISIAIGSEIEDAIGGTGNDLIIGNELDNLLTGGSGSDNFVLGSGGHDVVTDFEVGSDQIDLTSFGIQFDDLLISTSESGALVHYGESSLVLDGLAEEDVDESFFLFLQTPCPTSVVTSRIQRSGYGGKCSWRTSLGVF